VSNAVPSPEVSPASSRRPGVYEFSGFRLDCGRFELLHKGRPLRVERKPLELLILLVSRQGQLVTRTEISERLWSSEVFVDTEHGINTAIRKLRHLLRDDPDDPHFIQTVTGMGYRFVALVTAIAPVLPVEAVAESAAAGPEPTVAFPRRARGRRVGWYVAAACVVLAFGAVYVYRSRHRSPEVTYTQLTDFTDSAVAPTLSPDGRMVAFIRGSQAFLTSDQIYVKMLPNGEARRVTDDSRPKYGPAFSPDGSEIAYAVLDPSGFSTYEVSSLGGEPQLLMRNAGGLVWLDAQRLLFSEIPSGIHMGVVTATVTRAGLREIYFPAHERGMAHYSYPSPDRHWALVVEMNGDGWIPCRLVSLDGARAARAVGPAGACSSAGWSPDGAWMYFTAVVEERSHLWRQRFPEGVPEQITFGPTEEDGVAVEPTGRAVITSVGVHESAVWIHDGSGERPLSSEGEVAGGLSPPAFSPDDSTIYYLLRRGEGSATELWRTVVDSGKSEATFPGISMIGFDLSPDGKQVVYATTAPGGTTQVWLAPVDQSLPPRKVGSPGGKWPRFGARGQILFEDTEGNNNYLEQMNPDGSHRSKVVLNPIAEFQGVSPGRRWVMVSVSRTAEKDFPAVLAIPLDGGPARHMCTSYCLPRWSTDGKFLFVPVEEASRTSAGRSLAIPVGPGESLPDDFPAGGIPPLAEPSVVRGAQSVAREELVPGKDPEHYAWVNTTVHRNLYRISLP
jgi:Tol biopolymer transport system component/DNA-binding winged helix-turn-helix (wHTH) protein